MFFFKNFPQIHQTIRKNGGNQILMIFWLELWFEFERITRLVWISKNRIIKLPMYIRVQLIIQDVKRPFITKKVHCLVKNLQKRELLTLRQDTFIIIPRICSKISFSIYIMYHRKKESLGAAETLACIFPPENKNFRF